MGKHLSRLSTAVLLSGSIAIALTQTVCTAALADEVKPTKLDTDPHLVGWWKLDDASGKTAASSYY